ncbi:uncharacterized protein MCAP_0864-like isoform X2 [Adelges cooleyi]|uniref:uncharacterized protein MCAP_0864-like isoform X2 n=1 Tax=Adelges cooleyi TaxID=133065 RepID=UPI0021800EB0|nr:uncharacterized protein MCAP_0864-like isoform X2 [Adelges cooleyi]
MSDSCSENTDFLVSLPSDFFQVHTSDSETIEDTVTEEVSIESSSFKEVIDNLVTNLDSLTNQLYDIEKMETTYINNGLSSPLSASSPIRRTRKKEKQIGFDSIETLMNDMVKTYEYNNKIFKTLEKNYSSRNASFCEEKDKLSKKAREFNNEANNNQQSPCTNPDNINSNISILGDVDNFDSVSKENLWLKLGKEIYQRQNIEQKVVNLEEKISHYEKKLTECKEIDHQKTNLLDELAARSAMILNQVRKYSNINEKISQDLIAERKTKQAALVAMKEKIECYKSDLNEANIQINSYKDRTEAAEKRLNEVINNNKKVKEHLDKMRLDLEQKYKEIEIIQNELITTKEENKNLKNMYENTIKKCCQLESDMLLVDHEKKALNEKTVRYDQLLDQKRRIEEIVNEMKNKEAQTIDELNEAKEEIKTVKNELKLFYQKQLDAMLAEKVIDYQRKLDGIVQMTNEENNLIKRQMANKLSALKERYEKDKIQLKQKYSTDLEILENTLKEKSYCINALEKQLASEIKEKRQLVQSVMGVVKNVNVDNQPVIPQYYTF